MRIYFISLREQSSSQRFNEMEIKAFSLTTEQQEMWLASEVSAFTVIKCNCMKWCYFGVLKKKKVK